MAAASLFPLYQIVETTMRADKNKTVRLRARRSLTYATRRLMPGDVFEASARDARILLAVKKVKKVRDEAQVPPPPPAVAEKIASVASVNDDLLKARAEYEQVIGRKPYYGWDVKTLREKAALARHMSSISGDDRS